MLATLAICLLGTVLRCVWLARIGWHTPDLQWQGTPLLTSGDGYWFASGAGQLLTGAWGDNPRLPLPGDHALVALTWLVTRITPWSLDQVILYLPAVLGPLAAVPLVLIGRALGTTRLGLVAGLALVVAPALVARTSAGYFDTDPLALTVPLVIVLYLVRLFGNGRARDALAAALWLAAYPWFYNQGGSLGLALALTAAIGIGIQARARASPTGWIRHALVLIALSQLPLHPLLRVPLVVAGHVVLGWLATRHFALRPPRSLLIGLAIAFVALVAWRMGPIVVAKIGYFLGVDSAPAGAVSFGESADFVSETRQQSLAEIGVRLAGSLPALLLETLAFILLCARQPRLLLLAPLAALGAFTLLGGMRFGIYATPLLALGLAYGLTWISDRLRARTLSTLALTALTAATLAPAVARDWVMFGRPPVVAAEVEALDALRRVAAPPTATTSATALPTTVAWWDDGYPLLYFARTRTLVDGGWRDADVGLAAEILSSPSQRAAANLAQLAIATRDAGLQAMAAQGDTAALPSDWAIAPTLFEDARQATGLGLAAFLAQLARPDYRLPPVAGSAKPATSGGSIYLYLPVRLLAIVPVIEALRPHDPSAPPREPGVYRFDSHIEVAGTRITLGSGAVVDADQLLVTDGGTTRPLRTIYSLRGSGNALETRKRTRHPEAATSGIYLHDPGIFIELDERYLASTLIQLLVFQNAEVGLFERVYANGAARIFRIVTTP